MPALKACIVCGTPSHEARCPSHRVNKLHAYGWRHQQRRTQLKPAAIGTPCPKCGQLMLPGQPLDLDHTTPLTVDPSSLGDRIVHAHCNRATRGAGQPTQRRTGTPHPAMATSESSSSPRYWV